MACFTIGWSRGGGRSQGETRQRLFGAFILCLIYEHLDWTGVTVVAILALGLAMLLARALREEVAAEPIKAP